MHIVTTECYHYPHKRPIIPEHYAHEHPQIVTNLYIILKIIGSGLVA